jgi:N-formylglutamate amidohydrolase
VHVLQIELLRSLYMDEARFEKSAGFEDVSGIMARLLSALIDVASVLLPAPDAALPAAAE